VALDALQVRSQEDAKSRVDPAAIERLLSGVADDHESTRLAKQAQLPVSRTYVAVAIGEQPRAAASPEAVASIAARALTAVGLTTRQSVIGRTPAVLCESGVRLGEAIDALAGGAEERGFGLEIGVGQPGPLEHVARSWRQAREAIALRSLIADAGPAVYFEQLGILHLLAQIPRTELAAMEDFQRLTALDVDREGASDLDLLDEFLDSGSLRKTAAKMYMHHTTVEYRLRRIQRELGYSLSEPANRTRTKLVITLLRIHRVLGP
jgi:sugar diacid utilization regulator